MMEWYFMKANDLHQKPKWSQPLTCTMHNCWRRVYRVHTYRMKRRQIKNIYVIKTHRKKSIQQSSSTATAATTTTTTTTTLKKTINSTWRRKQGKLHCKCICSQYYTYTYIGYVFCLFISVMFLFLFSVSACWWVNDCQCWMHKYPERIANQQTDGSSNRNDCCCVIYMFECASLSWA